MGRYLLIGRTNPGASRPSDPSETMKAEERWYANIEESMKRGEIEDIGFFLNGLSGYAIVKGEAKDIYKMALAYHPDYVYEVEEIIPYEKGKEIELGILKERVDSSKK